MNYSHIHSNSIPSSSLITTTNHLTNTRHYKHICVEVHIQSDHDIEKLITHVAKLDKEEHDFTFVHTIIP